MKYRVFTRTWWKINPEWPDGREPQIGKEPTSTKHSTAQKKPESFARNTTEHTSPGNCQEKLNSNIYKIRKDKTMNLDYSKIINEAADGYQGPLQELGEALVEEIQFNPFRWIEEFLDQEILWSYMLEKYETRDAVYQGVLDEYPGKLLEHVEYEYKKEKSCQD